MLNLIVLPESLPVPKCGNCHAHPVAHLLMEIGGDEMWALCSECESGWKPKNARVGQFAVLTRTLEG